mmetsp:Transcript_60856/g.145054  ORF Transcript_60856/g.145054 Transcript_60856/m.145054 type:complete len:490 (-) Transcript_60856:136-1605(-)|eukprot:CAMPEP_0178428026 /NCGR_PEP_ID=MMETSP0689_2-20121128/30058_1 /TAXON_ID=160604 /ORGANISM="Amphidinium massartii, Strain CS-259" /LENGTH=489 /DNA_ID=CAMNT_0020049771 /DNA_START=91 /DNA_END=1560 /DNA_ORIENTATION=+
MPPASKVTKRYSVTDFIDEVGYGQYQAHCFVVCSGFIVAEASLLGMSASLTKVMGESIGIESELGRASLIACLFAGLGSGTILSGSLADPVGRRLPMFLGYLGMAVSSVLIASIPSTYIGVHILLYTLGLSAGTGIPISLITLAEVCPTSWRGFNAAAIGMSFSFGELWTGVGLRFFLPYMDEGPWHGMMLWAAFPSFAMLIFGLASPMTRYDTPLWLAANAKVDEVVKCLNLIANMNGRSDLTLGSDNDLDLGSVTDGHHDGGRGLLDSFRLLFRAPLYVQVLTMMLMFFAKDFAFYGMSVFWPITWRHLDVAEMLPATELCATAMLGIPGVLVAMIIMSHSPRRVALAALACLCILACLLLTRLGEQPTTSGLAGAMLFKICFPTWQMITMLLPAEVFPTEVKGIAYSTIAFCGRLATIVAPLVIGWSTTLFLQTTASLALMCAGVVFILPETSDLHPDKAACPDEGETGSLKKDISQDYQGTVKSV